MALCSSSTRGRRGGPPATSERRRVHPVNHLELVFVLTTVLAASCALHFRENRETSVKESFSVSAGSQCSFHPQGAESGHSALHPPSSSPCPALPPPSSPLRKSCLLTSIPFYFALHVYFIKQSLTRSSLHESSGDGPAPGGRGGSQASWALLSSLHTALGALPPLPQTSQSGLSL